MKFPVLKCLFSLSLAWALTGCGYNAFKAQKASSSLTSEDSSEKPTEKPSENKPQALLLKDATVELRIKDSTRANQVLFKVSEKAKAVLFQGQVIALEKNTSTSFYEKGFCAFASNEARLPEIEQVLKSTEVSDHLILRSSAKAARHLEILFADKDHFYHMHCQKIGFFTLEDLQSTLGDVFAVKALKQ